MKQDHAITPIASAGHAVRCAVVDPGPRPYTVTDMVAGLVAVALLEVFVGGLVANSTSAGWGVFVGATTFFILVTVAGLRLRAGIGRWLTARRLARTNLELASLGDTTIDPVELCESVLSLRRCTADDASPLRRLDIDRIEHDSDGAIPRVWVLTERGRAPTPGQFWEARFDDAQRRLVPCTVVRESLGRTSSTVSLVRTLTIILLAALMVVVVVMTKVHMIGCALSAILFFIIAGLVPMRRVVFVDRLLAASPQGLWLVLNDAGMARRERALRRRAKELGVPPEDVPKDDRVRQSLPNPEIRIPWQQCYAVLHRPKMTREDRARDAGTWRWRLYPPRPYWDALGVGGAFVIEADGINPDSTPWNGLSELLGVEHTQDDSGM